MRYTARLLSCRGRINPRFYTPGNATQRCFKSGHSHDGHNLQSLSLHMDWSEL